MNVEFVNPFLSAILNVLSTMAMTEAKAGKPFIKSSNMASGEVTGMIGLAGNQVRGSLAINFSRAAILHIASQMLGESFTEIDDTVKDVVGEITNMVTGGAKKSLAEQGHPDHHHRQKPYDHPQDPRPDDRRALYHRRHR